MVSDYQSLLSVCFILVFNFFQVFVCFHDFLFQTFFVSGKSFCQFIVAQSEHLHCKDSSIHRSVDGYGGYRDARRHLDNGIKGIHAIEDGTFYGHPDYGQRGVGGNDTGQSCGHAGCGDNYFNTALTGVSKNIQNQIANAQKKLQELSSNEELSIEDKMKKRQEIQQEINNLNQQLRQHQMEQRKEQQTKKTSMDDMLGGSRKTAPKSGNQSAGLSQASMQAMISADSSMKQAKVQGSMATQMEGKAGVLESEIKMDKGRGASTEKKEEELADLQAKSQAATAAQVSTLADANKKMEEAAKADQKVSKTEDKDKSKKKNADDKIDEDKKSEATGENQDITVDTNDSVPEKTVDAIPDGVNISTSEPVGHNVDVKL